MSIVLFLSLIGLSYGNPYTVLKMELAWKETITFDWANLDHKQNWFNWKQEFGKKYKSLQEEAKAFLTFLDNWKFINKWNIDNPNRYKLGMNQFGDMTSKQFKLYIHGGSSESCIKNRNVWQRVSMQEETPKGDAPTMIDWTNMNGKSYVTQVKNQGQCGSCWAFSTTGSIESRSAIAQSVTGADIVELSEQELVDCSKREGNHGCQGGLMDYGFIYVEKNGGLCSEKDYPYKAKNGRCQASSCKKKYDPIASHTDVSHDSSTALVNAVAKGPVSVAIQANQPAFQFYKSGIVDGRCGDRLDHGVLAVGYGSDGGIDFWKVKNSWGASWGEKGYVRLCRNCNKNGGEGECGILMQPSFPVVKPQ